MYLSSQIDGFVNTPPLWFKSEFGIQQFEFPQLDLSAYRPIPISQKLRLGHQIESLFKQLMDVCPAYDVLVHNLPIREDKQTLGEIDFILRKAENLPLVHVELTYKFYIVTTEVSDPVLQLIGPNKRDSFFAKMEKIKNNQFPLLHSDAGITALNKLNIDSSKISHQACFKAQLFLPFEQKNIDLQPFNLNCVVGYWLRLNDFHIKTFGHYKFYLPHKGQWIIEPHNNVQWSSFSKILPEIHLQAEKQNSPMVWIRKTDSRFEKIFILWW